MFLCAFSLFFLPFRDGIGRSVHGSVEEKGKATHSHLDAAGGLTADGHVEEANGVGHFCLCLKWFLKFGCASKNEPDGV